MSDFDEISSSPQWYIIHTYLGYESRVKTNLEKIIENRKLQNVIFDIYIPVEEVTQKDRKGVEQIVEKNLFPTYVFIKMIMSDETWHIVRNITGVTGFVGPGSRPEPVPDEEIAKLGLAQSAQSLGFAKGDTVKITSGTLAGNTAVIDSISEDQKKITVIVSMFGRELPFEADADSIEKVD